MGMYSPMAQGQIHGHKEGLDTSFSLWEFIEKTELKHDDKEYLVGFWSRFF